MKLSKDVWVIIPAYNEEKRVGKVIDEVKRFSRNVVLVDDGSKDDTYDVGLQKKIKVLRHVVNLGKGAGLKTGCDYALLNGAKTIIVIDADGQHEPKEIPNFIESLEGVDIVFGYRRFTGHMPFVLKFGNNFINFVTKILYGVDLKDTQSGYRAFTSKAYRRIRWNANDYSMESEMIANVGKNNLKYREIPIQTIYSDRYKGTTVLDGVKIVFNMVKWRLLG